MNVPLLDLKAQYAAIRGEVDAAVRRVFESQQFIMGPEVAELERRVAAYCGAAHAVGVSSGTDALLVALMAEGIGPGDEVVTSPYTFFATAGSIARLGAKPVFVDIDPETYNLRPDAIAGALTSRTRAVMPVHLYGQCAEMDDIMRLAASRGLCVIEDACQAIGASYRGRKAGSLGAYGCFSFFPSKNLGGAGDGGMVVTDDPARADRVAELRVHGSKRKYHHRVVGANFRLDTLQAAVLLAKLPRLDAWMEARRANAARYARLLGGLAAARDGRIRLPAERVPVHVFNQYVIRAERRDELRAFLTEREIGTEIYYPVPLHRQECFKGLGYVPGSFPESERAAAQTLALPVYPELTDDQAAWVAESVDAFYRR